jgi:hypothetical protein
MLTKKKNIVMPLLPWQPSSVPRTLEPAEVLSRHHARVGFLSLSRILRVGHATKRKIIAKRNVLIICIMLR